MIETAHRTLKNCGQIFRYAIASGRSTNNPASALKDALRRPESQHFPAITDPKRFGELLPAWAAYLDPLRLGGVVSRQSQGEAGRA